jgi:macrolide transport system ATP-binding/permease protein
MSTILQLEHISKSYGFNTVLDDVSFHLNSGERIGIVGANGVGKSTLLKIITGAVTADSGSATIAPAARVGYLAQTLPPDDALTIADLIDRAMSETRQLEAHMRQLEGMMAHAGGAALDEALTAYGDATERYEALGGYEIDARLEAIFTGLGVAHLERERRLASLSGGEGTRLMLALTLVQAPDLLLLDEPTNHLDAAALAWLEGYLASVASPHPQPLSRTRSTARRGGFSGSALIVSHDREFLNRTVSAIIEIDEHTRGARRYAGNYDAYRAAKAQERKRWEADYAAQQDEMRALRIEIKQGAHQNTNYRAHTDNDKFVRNIKIDTHAATVSRRIRDAEVRLERLLADPIPKPPTPLAFEADFDPTTVGSSLPLRAHDIRKAYGERVLFSDIDLDVRHGDRIAITGANGAGKSTLLRILAGVIAADGGSVRVAPDVRLGYLPQETDNLTPLPLARLHSNGEGATDAKSLFEAYAEGLDSTPKDLMNDLVRSGLFRYDDTFTRVGDLSAGQRRKLQLARLMAERANVLLLDEPTNHLSPDVLEELEAALRDFPGAVIAVSHDRRFLAGFGGVEVGIGM